MPKHVFSSLLISVIVASTVSCKKVEKKTDTNDSKTSSGVEKKTMSGHLEQIDVSGRIRALEIPNTMLFAGETVPLGEVDVYERFERELYVNTFWHSSTILLLKRASRWLPQISAILKEHDVPDDFKYLAVIESGLQNVVSPSKAVGFWQILKPTGKELGLEINKEVDERYDPIKSTHAAAKYLKKSFENFGSWTNAAAAYNRGNRGIREVLDEQKVSSYYDLKLNEETSRYVFRILAAKEILEHPDAYGFDLLVSERYQPEETFEFKVEENIKDLSAFAVKNGINYKLLTRYNPWLQKNKLSVKKGNSYTFNLPLKYFPEKTVVLK